jgi:outer membrane protein assembly factor BamB
MFRQAVFARCSLASLTALMCVQLTAACGDDDGSDDKAHAHEDAGANTKTGPSTTADAGSGHGTSKAFWNMMGHDSRNTYFQPEETLLTTRNAADLKEKWRFEVKGFPPGSAVIAEGKVFVMASGATFAIDLDTGNQLWMRDDITGTASLAYADGFVYAHTSAGANLYKLSAADGSTQWGPVQSNPTQSRCDGTSSPIVAGKTVLVGHSCGVPEVTGGADQLAARGGVEAFNTDDGSQLWTYWTVPESGENGAMVWSTVSVDIDAGVVFAATGNNYSLGGEHSDSIHAIDLESGERKWVTQVRSGDTWSLSSGMPTTGTDTDFGANPILVDIAGQKLVAAGDKGASFWALDRETGDKKWSYEKLSDSHTPNNGGVLNNGASDGKYFYVASNDPSPSAGATAGSQLHVLDVKTGEDAVPPKRLDANVWGALSVTNELLFVPVNTVLQVYDKSTLELLNSFETGGTIAAGAAAIVDGNVVVKSGLQYAFGSDAKNNDQIICYGVEHGATSTADAGTKSSMGAATWSGVYSDVIVGSGCSGSALCHGGDIGHLTMKDKASAYKALVGVDAMGSNLVADSGPNCKDSGLKRVVAGKPDDSLMMLKLEGKQPCGDAMPPTGKLSADRIDQVRKWIENGAKND